MYFPVVAMTRVATTTILLILLALLLPVFAIGADAFFALDKEAYELGQPVLVHIPSPDIGTTIVRITGPDGMHRYRGNAEQVEFYPLVLGHYSLEARHTQEHLFSQEFDVLSPVLESKPLPLFLEKQRYRVNQEVRFHLQLESGHDYRLHVSSEEEEFSFMGNLNPIAVFRPQTPGTYIVELLDRTANEIHEHGFLVEERRPINFLKLADRKGRSAQSRIKVYKGMHQIFDSDVDDELAPGVYNLELERPLKNIERIRLRGFNASTNNTLLLEEVKPRVRGKPALDGFAIDPTKTTFEDGTVTKRATGDELWKCAEWNFTTASCEGDWIRLRSLVPGELYTIDINSTDPAFVETSINVLNVQSYPMVGGTWRVEFTTLGIANLSIRAINGTTWNDILETEDLKLLSLKCGNENIPYTWQNSILFVEDYSCNATAIETSLVLTEGVHNLEFTFGNDTAYANNYASATGVLIFRDKTGGDDANAAEPGANVTWDTQDRLDIIYSHTSGEANITISTDGIYHLSYGIMVNRTDSTNNRNEITARVKVNGQILPSCYANTYLRAQ
ncbi:hypothetical protein GOV07_01205, partial [Candidatus Woesearchaeota archaeon]|nr:hypothetical protein [Candidatus Woesearchaeota archaeon]